jgi:DNA polymerase-3 subunit epsilon
MSGTRAFVAIDFETADSKRDSACAVGLTKVSNGRIVDSLYALIRPPRSRFSPFCVRVHGIHWSDVKGAPLFRDFWIEHAGFLEGVDFLAAHNAGFDRSVLGACCASSGLSVPRLPFVCTVDLARNMWNLRPTKLPDVCRFLGLDLQHHHAASDSEACARIVMAAVDEDPACLASFGL